MWSYHRRGKKKGCIEFHAQLQAQALSGRSFLSNYFSIREESTSVSRHRASESEVLRCENAVYTGQKMVYQL